MAVGIEIATQTPKKIATIRAISPTFSGWPERRYPVEGRRNMVRGIRVTRPQVRHRSGDRAPHGASRRLGSTLEGPAAGSRWRSRRKPLEDAASARATNDQGKLVFRPRKGLPRMADISVANTTYRGAHDGAQPVRDSLERPGPESDEPVLVVPPRGVHPRERRTMPVLRMRVSILHPGGRA